MADSVIDIKDLTFKREGRKIFDDISFSIPKGKISVIMGPSGTGKTTMLHLMGGLIRPEEGTINILGSDITKISRRDKFHLRKDMGFLFQSGALFSDMNVFDNIAFPLREHSGLPESIIKDIVVMKLEAVGLRGAMYLHPSELSGGMSRRVALARAIALDPKVLFYDEPFTGQDPISCGMLIKLMRSLNDLLHLTSVVVSHNVSHVMHIADHIFILSEGKLVESGSPEEITATREDRSQQFIHGLPDGPVPFHYPAGPLSEDLLTSNKEIARKRRKRVSDEKS